MKEFISNRSREDLEVLPKAIPLFEEVQDRLLQNINFKDNLTKAYVTTGINSINGVTFEVGDEKYAANISYRKTFRSIKIARLDTHLCQRESYIITLKINQKKGTFSNADIAYYNFPEGEKGQCFGLEAYGKFIELLKKL